MLYNTIYHSSYKELMIEEKRNKNFVQATFFREKIAEYCALIIMNNNNSIY